jgi:hypothetical protein
MLLTRFAQKRRVALWLHRARACAERWQATARRLAAAGDGTAAVVFAKAAWRALLYAVRAEQALARLGGRA